MDQERKMRPVKENGTFVVRIQYCENATWQGEIFWKEKKESLKFRSALELLRLIDSALEPKDDENKIQWGGEEPMVGL